MDSQVDSSPPFRGVSRRMCRWTFSSTRRPPLFLRGLMLHARSRLSGHILLLATCPFLRMKRSSGSLCQVGWREDVECRGRENLFFFFFTVSWGKDPFICGQKGPFLIFAPLTFAFFRRCGSARRQLVCRGHVRLNVGLAERAAACP